MKKIFIQIITMCLILTYYNAVENKLNFDVLVSDNVESFDFNKVKREYIRGERASAIFFVSGFSVNKSNKINISVNVKALNPENKYEAEINFISSYAIKDNQKYIPLDGIYDLYFNEKDPVGTYWIEAIVTDNISKVSKTKKISILLFDNQKSKEIIMKQVQSAKHLDELWEDYFRSKNPWAIKRIISALRYINSKNGNAILIGNAAKWSLTSNAIQHNEVLKICKSNLNAMPTRIKLILKEVILEAEKKYKINRDR